MTKTEFTPEEFFCLTEEDCNLESAEKLLPEWKFLEDKLISADLDDGYTSTEFIFEHTSTNKFYGCIVHYSEYEGYEGPFDLYEVEPYSTIAYRRINNDQTDSAVQA